MDKLCPRRRDDKKACESRVGIPNKIQPISQNNTLCSNSRDSILSSRSLLSSYHFTCSLDRQEYLQSGMLTSGYHTADLYVVRDGSPRPDRDLNLAPPGLLSQLDHRGSPRSPPRATQARL